MPVGASSGRVAASQVLPSDRVEKHYEAIVAIEITAVDGQAADCVLPMTAELVVWPATVLVVVAVVVVAVTLSNGFVPCLPPVEVE